MEVELRQTLNSLGGAGDLIRGLAIASIRDLLPELPWSEEAKIAACDQLIRESVGLVVSGEDGSHQGILIAYMNLNGKYPQPAVEERLLDFYRPRYNGNGIGDVAIYRSANYVLRDAKNYLLNILKKEIQRRNANDRWQEPSPEAEAAVKRALGGLHVQPPRSPADATIDVGSEASQVAASLEPSDPNVIHAQDHQLPLPPLTALLANELSEAIDQAEKAGQQFYTAHLLHVLMQLPNRAIFDIFESARPMLGSAVTRWAERARLAAKEIQHKNVWPIPQVSYAQEYAKSHGSKYTNEYHVLLGIIDTKSGTRERLKSFLTKGDVQVPHIRNECISRLGRLDGHTPGEDL